MKVSEGKVVWVTEGGIRRTVVHGSLNGNITLLSMYTCERNERGQ